MAQIALGGSDVQTVKALIEADAWHGPSLIIAYSTCIAHGIDMATSMGHQKEAVRSGYWPLYRFHPSDRGARATVPARLGGTVDPTDRVRSLKEARFAMLAQNRSGALGQPARPRPQADVDERWRYYEQLRAAAWSHPPTTTTARTSRWRPLRRETSHDGSDHAVPGADPAVADRGVRVPPNG